MSHICFSTRFESTILVIYHILKSKHKNKIYLKATKEMFYQTTCLLGEKFFHHYETLMVTKIVFLNPKITCSQHSVSRQYSGPMAATNVVPLGTFSCTLIL